MCRCGRFDALCVSVPLIPEKNTTQLWPTRRCMSVSVKFGKPDFCIFLFALSCAIVVFVYIFSIEIFLLISVVHLLTHIAIMLHHVALGWMGVNVVPRVRHGCAWERHSRKSEIALSLFSQSWCSSAPSWLWLWLLCCCCCCFVIPVVHI